MALNKNKRVDHNRMIVLVECVRGKYTLDLCYNKTLMKKYILNIYFFLLSRFIMYVHILFLPTKEANLFCTHLVF